MTVEQLLLHTSGLPSWKPLYRTCKSYRELLKVILETPLEAEPGSLYRYSDLGFILLGELAAKTGGQPLAALDQGLKSRIIPYMRHVRDELAIPILYVSHSVAEILELTGQVIVLDHGRVVAHGDFFKVATHPEVLPLVEEYGFENVLAVEIVATDERRGICEVDCHGQALKIPHCDRAAGDKLFVGIRADDIILARNRPEGLSVRNALRGTISEIADVEGKQLIYVDVGRRLAVKTTLEAVEELGLVVGDTLYCLVKTHSIRIGPEVQ